MSNDDVFGPLKDATLLELAVIRTLGGGRALGEDDTPGWLSTYLGRLEVQTPGYEYGDLHRPRTWQSDIDVRWFPEGQLPAVSCVVGAGTPYNDGEFIHLQWAFAVGIALKGTDRQEGRDIARLYGAATYGALMHNPSLGGVVQGLQFVGIAAREVRGNPGVVAATAELAFTATMPDVLQLNAGPRTPDPLPDPPGGEEPTYPDTPVADSVDFRLHHLDEPDEEP